MMSSFRPDPHYRKREFVAASMFGTEGSGFVPESQASTLALAAESNVGPETSFVEWTPEQLEASEQAAFERGAESAREASERLSQTCEVLEASAAALQMMVSTSVVTNRELILSLAMEIAEKWVAAELQLDPALFGRALDRAIDAIEGVDGASLVLHPADRERLLSAEAARVARWSQDFSLEVEEDPSLDPGMFRVDAGTRSIDGNFEAIRERLHDALSAAFEADLPVSPE